MATSQQREPAEQSESGKTLKGHIFKSKRVQDPHECLMFCYSELTCQSYIYVMTGNLCELNNRTKEARPRDFVRDETRFYVRRWKNRGTDTIKHNLYYHIKVSTKWNLILTCKCKVPSVPGQSQPTFLLSQNSSTKYLFSHSNGGNLFFNYFWNREVVLEKGRETFTNRKVGLVWSNQNSQGTR